MTELVPVDDIRVIEQDNGITVAYQVDRRGDWHLIARSDVRHAETVRCTLCGSLPQVKCVSVFNAERVRAFPHFVRFLAATRGTS
jgi:hypothetical protein